MHVIEQFNGGMYDTIIASDEKFLSEEAEATESNDASNKKSKNKPKR